MDEYNFEDLSKYFKLPKSLLNIMQIMNYKFTEEEIHNEFIKKENNHNILEEYTFYDDILNLSKIIVMNIYKIQL